MVVRVWSPVRFLRARSVIHPSLGNTIDIKTYLGRVLALWEDHGAHTVCLLCWARALAQQERVLLATGACGCRLRAGLVAWFDMVDPIRMFNFLELNGTMVPVDNLLWVRGGRHSYWMVWRIWQLQRASVVGVGMDGDVRGCGMDGWMDC